MIGRPTAAAVGLTQMVNWGVSYYAVGVFAPVIAADLGWSLARTHAGFSLALVPMALSSGAAGRLVAARGSRALAAGSVLLALGLAMLGTSGSFSVHAAGWIVAGLGMRLCLYEAAFAALVRAGGTGAPCRRSRCWAGSPRPCSGRWVICWPKPAAGAAGFWPMPGSRWRRHRCS
ncbi:hypothetical protein [Rhodovulum visakhapatnamense]|uniref:MFS transporter n=1 Tax=Rhodovulum visakhapatnamense TaxID=364297 RepID=A0A4R8G1D1_9RHOB|nr:hypothetical protein [Rhodovulum visakhapatnamense]TDX31817.1 hypothetical protein EV657_10413 [Rhodovulum visakhapatnamense]